MKEESVELLAQLAYYFAFEIEIAKLDNNAEQQSC